MRTSVEKLEWAIEESRKLGYEVRLESLGGAAGGLCEVGRKKYIFVDLTAPVLDQLEQILAVLREQAPGKSNATASQSEAA